MDNQTSLVGKPILHLYEFGEPGVWNQTETAICVNLIIYYTLFLFASFAKQYNEFMRDENDSSSNPTLVLVEKILDNLRFLPMLLILLIFSLLRGKVDLEQSEPQAYASSAAISTTYIILLQIITTSFSVKYTESMKHSSPDNNLPVRPVLIVNLCHVLQTFLLLAYYVCIVFIFVGIFNMNKTLPLVRPNGRGDPVV